MNYHIARENQQLGVYPREEVVARYQRGELRPNDLAWCEGMANWQPLSEVFGPPPAGGTPPAPSLAPPAPLPPVTGPLPSAVRGTLPPKPDNNLVWAILTTVLCCMPFGVVAIVYASQVDGKYLAGDYDGAVRSASLAKRWSIISAVSVVAIGIIYAIVMGVMAALAAAGGRY